MAFYNQPAFWAFLTTVIPSVFGMIHFYFNKKDKSNDNKAKLDISIENIKKSSLQESIDYLNGVVARIEPLVVKHDATMKDMEESIKLIGIIEKGLNSMSNDLITKYEDFHQKLVNVTVSFQKTIDRVDNMDKKMSNLGRVIKL